MDYRMEQQLEREENALHDAYERGEISAEELQEELREIQRDFQAAAEQAALDAYAADMDRWQ